MSLQNSSSIYLGTWTDRTHGNIYGATLTLSHRDGTLLTTFAATFTTFVCAQLWLILSFIIYHARSGTKPQDGLTHQRQAVLRNANSLSASWIFVRQGLKWHKKARAAAIRSLGWVILTLAFAGASGLASTFTAYTTSKASPNRLLISNNCGYWTTVDIGTGKANLTSYALAKVSDTLTAANYARSCYDANSDSVQCRKYITPRLNWTSTQNASCPFESGSCRFGDQAAFAMQSDVLDSMHDLGINSPPSERLTLQKKTVCAPIIEAQHYMKTNGTVEYYFGPINAVSDFTMVYKIEAASSLVGYSVVNVYSYANQESEWTPIPALNRTDADVSMVFIAQNSIQYTYPNNDPVFGATTPSFFARGRYSSDLWVGTIACAEQYQVCNPAKSTCSGWVGAVQYLQSSSRNSQASVPPLWEGHGMTQLQIAISERLAWVLYMTNVYNTINTRAASALQLQDHLYDLFQTANVPDDQWTFELSGWFEASLARIQQEISAFATGPTVGREGMIQSFTSEDAKSLCKAQLTRNTGDTMNFSLLGLGLVFGIGSLIIVTSFCIGSLSSLFYKLWPQKFYKRAAWDADFFLQSHRRAFADNEYVHWTADDIPIALGRQKMVHYSTSFDRYESIENRTNQRSQNGNTDGEGNGSEEIHVVEQELIFKSR